MRSLLVFVTCFLISINLLAQSKKITVQPIPLWVSQLDIDYNDTQLDKDAEDGYSDLDYEEQVFLQDQTTFYKKAIRILSTAGVENASEISIIFDPSYSQLIFHSLRIIRSGKSIDKLNIKDFQVVQQETELSKHIYNGNVTAFLILKDVRKGDIIEYSYSIKGFNLIFKNKYDDAFYFNSGAPNYNMLYKVIVPPGRNIQTKFNGDYIQPAIVSDKYGTSYEWIRHNIPALKMQDHVPSWFNPYHTLMISEYSSWAEVVDWARGLFNSNTQISSGLKNEIHRIDATSITVEKKVLAALMFVQDEIRYVGIEIGENSHKPHDPNKVFQQRFGDCKDKSYLFCTMLNAMKIEASPVLISTYEKKGLLNILPCIRAFDHVTVRVKLNNKYYWFDPTITYQRGGIEDISFPDYQYGLVVENGARELAKIQLQDKGNVQVKEKFDILNKDGDAKFSVVTEYTGSFADEIRSSCANNSQAEIRKNYKNFYASYYENIEADSIQFDDDELTGRMMVKEFYTLQNVWKLTDGKKETNFDSYVINSVLKKPKELVRTMPFELSYPSKYIEDIQINLPDDWDVSEYKDYISNNAFKMKADFSYSNRVINLHYEYENLKDHVLPQETKDYMVGYNLIENNMGFNLTNNEKKNNINADTAAVSMQQPSFGMVFLYILIAILLLACLIVLSTKLK